EKFPRWFEGGVRYSITGRSETKAANRRLRNHQDEEEAGYRIPHGGHSAHRRKWTQTARLEQSANGARDCRVVPESSSELHRLKSVLLEAMMGRKALFGMAAVGLAIAGIAGAGGAQVSTGQASLTVYNQMFAVVRQMIPLELKAGTNHVTFADITAHLEP